MMLSATRHVAALSPLCAGVGQNACWWVASPFPLA